MRRINREIEAAKFWALKGAVMCPGIIWTVAIGGRRLSYVYEDGLVHQTEKNWSKPYGGSDYD